MMRILFMDICLFVRGLCCLFVSLDDMIYHVCVRVCACFCGFRNPLGTNAKDDGLE